MPGRVAHVAFNTDDEDATRAFYEGLFEWRFEPYYPGFVRTVLPPAAEFVAAVLGDVLARVAELGGAVVMERATIPSVGDLAFLTDPSGNLVGVIEYAGT